MVNQKLKKGLGDQGSEKDLRKRQHLETRKAFKHLTHEIKKGWYLNHQTIPPFPVLVPQIPP